MDHKELIDILRMTASCRESICYECSECFEAAAAIETLLAELDAAVEDIPKHCSLCSHFKKQDDSKICYDCWYVNGAAINWKWRGPKDKRK